MTRHALYLLPAFLITLIASYVQAQQNPVNTAVPAGSAGASNSAEPYTFDSLHKVSIPSPKIPPFPHIASPKIPPFPEIASPKTPAFPAIASPKIPRFPDIPSPDTRFTEHTFPQIQEIPSIPSLPPATNIPPTQVFTPSGEGGGGGKTAPQNVSSTPVGAPQSPYAWGKSSSPVSSPAALTPLPPNVITPYVWGQSSSPISAPLPLQPLTPNQQTPYTWGISSTPTPVYQKSNPLTPYVYGRSSTPTPRSLAAPNLGPSSTPRGASSTPHGGSSTPQGGSSTPHGQSSTPHGQSSTPRAR